LIGFGNDTIEKATDRLERVWELDCIPHAQLYQPADRHIEYSREWRELACNWSRPAIMYGMHKAREVPAPSSQDERQVGLFGEATNGSC